MRKFRKLIIKGIIIVFIVAILIVLSVLKNNPDIAEAMTRGPARFYGNVVSKITGLVTFVSFTELLFVALFCIGVLLLVLFVINLVKLRVISAISKIVDIALIALSVITVYHFSCEAAYNRYEMPLPYYEGDVERTEYIDIFNFFADDLNLCISQMEFDESGDVKDNRKLDEIAKEVKKAYEIINDDYFASHNGAVKPMMSSFVYREFQITGVTFSPLAEANIDTLIPIGDLPFTVAHELAHTKGVMREDDANILAFYVCLNSDNPYLRFSAYNRYFNLISTMGSGTYLTDEEMTHLTKINSAYYKMISFERKFWKEHNLLKHIGDWINNLYIKSSGIEEGTSSYSGGTDYVYDPTEHKITNFSTVQKLFLEKYYCT